MKESKYKQYGIHLLLFILTLITTTMAGAEWIFGRSFFYGENTMGWYEFKAGLEFSIPFLLILTVHEFGHYLTAQYNKVRVSLPYYLPVWFGFVPFMLSIGTVGAFIRIKDRISVKRLHFDIGIAGPLAGFVVAIGVLWFGFTHLPEPEYIYQIHPEYEQYGLEYDQHVYDNDSILNVSLGSNLTFMFFEKYVVDDPSKIPSHYEMMHYPWLFAGFLALLFTALNLLPIGQLDGGHVLYGLLGKKWHKHIAEWIFILFITYAGVGIFTPYDALDSLVWIPLYIAFIYLLLKGMGKSTQDTLMYAVAIFSVQFLISGIWPTAQGYSGWLMFAFIIARFLGIHHPGAINEAPLDMKRQVLGWIALIVFIISFSPAPLIIG